MESSIDLKGLKVHANQETTYIEGYTLFLKIKQILQVFVLFSLNFTTSLQVALSLTILVNHGCGFYSKTCVKQPLSKIP